MRAVPMAGFIYFFSTLGDAEVYKAGETRQDTLAARLRGYLGPSKPRVIVVSRAVDDAREAERLMLALLRQCAFYRARTDYGDEWFGAVPSDPDERHAAAVLIGDVVQRAVRSAPARPVPRAHHAAEPADATDAGDGTLGGYNAYFAKLDAFVRDAPPAALANHRDLLGAFDASEACPIYAEYGRHGLEARLAVARRRYPWVGEARL